MGHSVSGWPGNYIFNRRPERRQREGVGEGGDINFRINRLYICLYRFCSRSQDLGINEKERKRERMDKKV